MIITTLLTLLAASEVSQPAPPEAPAPKIWSVQLSLATPSVLRATFELSPPTGQAGLGVLGALSAFTLTNSLTGEFAIARHWTTALSLGFGFGTGSGLNTTVGSGAAGVRWYVKQPFEGFWAGPETIFQLTSYSGPVITGSQMYLAGARARVGWTQPFGENFLVAASAGAGADMLWLPDQSTRLGLGLDLALTAGLVF